MTARALLPVAILGVGLLGFVLFMVTRPEVDRHAPESVAPLVRIMTVEPRAHRFEVVAHGAVEPPIDTQLRAQVAGEIVWVSPNLAPGGFFERDEPLVTIDPTDYEDGLEAARADRDRAASSLSRAKRAHERQQSLTSQSAGSVARADEASDAYRAADATLREARARLSRAERDLERTHVRAPYAGRARDKKVDIGQFVRRGDDLAELYAIEYAEVPLPVSDAELAFLDLPHPFRKSDRSELIDGPGVELRAHFAGTSSVWTGRLVRTAAEIDARSRTITVVARVEDPYGRTPEGPSIPLPVGLFVEARIEGREIPDAVVLPTTALREESRVYVVDDEGLLHFRSVEVLRRRRDEIIVGSGLNAGERVVVSPIRGAVEGMRVRTEVRVGGAEADTPRAEPSA